MELSLFLFGLILGVIIGYGCGLITAHHEPDFATRFRNKIVGKTGKN